MVCLLPPDQLAYYSVDLLSACRAAFALDDVLSAPIEDFCLSSQANLKSVMDFLDASVRPGKKTVVHCSCGSGRTGHVLAAWLVHHYGMDARAAADTVMAMPERRNPLEAVTLTTTEADLYELLNSVRGALPGNSMSP